MWEPRVCKTGFYGVRKYGGLIMIFLGWPCIMGASMRNVSLVWGWSGEKRVMQNIGAC